jgi:hypothetical protein
MDGQTVINKQQQIWTSLKHYVNEVTKPQKWYYFIKEWLDTYVLHTYSLLASSANSADGEIFI